MVVTEQALQPASRVIAISIIAVAQVLLFLSRIFTQQILRLAGLDMGAVDLFELHDAYSIMACLCLESAVSPSPLPHIPITPPPSSLCAVRTKSQP